MNRLNCMNRMTQLQRFRRGSRKAPFVFGHRGASALLPENSLAAFQKAVDDGADGVELDVRATADGTLVISHDDRLAFDGQAEKLSLRQLTYSQLKTLRTKGGHSVLTLREVLLFQARTGTLMNVEIKGDAGSASWLSRESAKQIEAHGGDGIIVSSFSPLVVWHMARLLPEVPCAFLSEKDGLALPAVPPAFLGATAIHPKAMLVDERLMQEAKSRELVVNTWTVNDPKEAERLSALGVDALICDNPGYIKRALGG